MNNNRKPGDWDCRNCGHLNFCRRDSCQRCCDARPVVQDYSSFDFNGAKPGDWYCSCSIRNYANRPNCFKCGGSKDTALAVFGLGWKSGDWLCTRSGCNEHNFASRIECYKCSTPRGWGNQSYSTY